MVLFTDQSYSIANFGYVGACAQSQPSQANNLILSRQTQLMVAMGSGDETNIDILCDLFSSF